jgi:hypothetical protein
MEICLLASRVLFHIREMCELTDAHYRYTVIGGGQISFKK